MVRVLDRILPSKLINPAQVPDHIRVARRGEEDAYFHLRGLGYVIVARNWQTPGRKGEVDLIGWDGDVLCFVEVKTRSSRQVKPAEAAVDAAKQHELRAMAWQFVRRALRRGSGRIAGAGDNTAYRFDVVSIYYDNPSRRATDITLYRNAFPVS